MYFFSVPIILPLFFLRFPKKTSICFVQQASIIIPLIFFTWGVAKSTLKNLFFPLSLQPLIFWLSWNQLKQRNILSHFLFSVFFLLYIFLKKKWMEKNRLLFFSPFMHSKKFLEQFFFCCIFLGTLSYDNKVLKRN